MIYQYFSMKRYTEKVIREWHDYKDQLVRDHQKDVLSRYFVKK